MDYYREKKLKEIYRKLEQKDYSFSKRIDKLLGVTLIATGMLLHTPSEPSYLAYSMFVVGAFFLYMAFFMDYVKIAKFLVKRFYKPLYWLSKKDEKAVKKRMKKVK